MSLREAPAWLGELQAAFGAILRKPLDRGTGTLRALTDEYDLSLGATDGARADARERLAVYHRQYWFRLFGVMQAGFPLTARLLGFWHFNEFAAAFLVAHPPHAWDIGRAADGFAPFLGDAIAGRTLRVGTPARDVAGDLVAAAAAIDEVFRHLFDLAPEPAWRPSQTDAARLLSARLVPARTACLVEERWPLSRLRQDAIARGDLQEIMPPDALTEPAFWAVFQTHVGVSQARLSRLEASLWRLLGEHPVERALGLLEASCTDAERATLPALTQTFLARSVELHFWTGLREEPEAP